MNKNVNDLPEDIRLQALMTEDLHPTVSIPTLQCWIWLIDDDPSELPCMRITTRPARVGAKHVIEVDINRHRFNDGEKAIDAIPVNCFLKSCVDMRGLPSFTRFTAMRFVRDSIQLRQYAFPQIRYHDCEESDEEEMMSEDDEAMSGGPAVCGE